MTRIAVAYSSVLRSLLVPSEGLLESSEMHFQVLAK